MAKLTLVYSYPSLRPQRSTSKMSERQGLMRREGSTRETSLLISPHNYRARAVSRSAQSQARLSHSGADVPSSSSSSSGGGGGEGFVGPMLTTMTSTLSSPVTTVPPSFPQESAEPSVELVIPPSKNPGCITNP